VPPVQELLQAPQLARSCAVSTQPPPQFSCPGWQLAAHCPAAHTAPAAQALPHAPQLAGSVRGSTHLSPHACIPAGHTHAPPLQSFPAEQRLPHDPQFAAELARSTHAREQAVSSGEQLFAQAATLQTCSGVHACAQTPQ